MITLTEQETQALAGLLDADVKAAADAVTPIAAE